MGRWFYDSFCVWFIVINTPAYSVYCGFFSLSVYLWLRCMLTRFSINYTIYNVSRSVLMQPLTINWYCSSMSDCWIWKAEYLRSFAYFHSLMCNKRFKNSLLLFKLIFFKYYARTVAHSILLIYACVIICKLYILHSRNISYHLWCIIEHLILFVMCHRTFHTICDVS